MKKLNILIFVILLLSLSACSIVRTITASLRSTERFIPLTSDERILYEPGAEEFAKEIKPLLPEAIYKVEAGHYMPFTGAVKVYICASSESYYRLTGQKAPAIVTNKLCFSPVIFWEKRPLDRYLTHELAHFHLLQRIGIVKNIKLPAWFKEGNAELVSGGATGSKITDQEAYKAIIEHHNFIPDGNRRRLSRPGNIYSTSGGTVYRKYRRCGSYIPMHC